MASPVPFTYVVRRSVLAEWYGAQLFAKAGAAVLETDPISTPTAEILALKRPFLVGAYFRDHLDKFEHPVAMFVQDGEDISLGPELSKRVTVVRAAEGCGFAAYAAHAVHAAAYAHNIAELLDHYQYGWMGDSELTRNAADFQHGVYALEGKTAQEKILKVTPENFDAVVAAGRPVRVAFARVVANRLGVAAPMRITYGGVALTALVANGDSPIVETCAALAAKSESGVGILYRRNARDKRTLVSIRVTRESGLNAGEIAKRLFGGGGARAMGGGGVEGAWEPSDFIDGRFVGAPASTAAVTADAKKEEMVAALPAAENPEKRLMRAVTEVMVAVSYLGDPDIRRAAGEFLVAANQWTADQCGK